MKLIKRKLLLFLRGMAMGAVDLVPGVSAGTIALVTGIYDELVHSIKSFNLQALRILKNEGLVPAWRYINGQFLVILVAGILFSLFSFAGIMRFLLDMFPLQLWSFFIGLIIASVIYLLRQQSPARFFDMALLVLGILCAYGISVSPAVVIEGSYISLFFAGSLALCAMILPGISGSFILVLLGLYPAFINALVNVQIDFLLVFATGGVVGLMLFSRLLSWLLDHYKSAVISTMCGFLAGSISILWPWKVVTPFITSASGKQIVTASQNLTPQGYLEVVGQNPQTLSCILMFLAGIIIVFGVEAISTRLKKKRYE